MEGFATLTNPKYEVYKDKAGEFRFRLQARNGEPILASEGYKAKASCENGIASVRKNAPDADVVKKITAENHAHKRTISIKQHTISSYNQNAPFRFTVKNSTVYRNGSILKS